MNYVYIAVAVVVITVVVVVVVIVHHNGQTPYGCLISTGVDITPVRYIVTPVRQ